MKERKVSAAAGRMVEEGSALLLQFLLYHCTACLAMGLFYSVEQPGVYAWFLLLAVPLCYLTLVRKLAGNFIVFFALHILVLFMAVFWREDFWMNAVITIWTLLMTVFSLYACVTGKGRKLECPSLWMGILLLVCHFLGKYYLGYPALTRISYYEVLLYAVFYLLHTYHKNMADFICMNQNIANFPAGQITVINRLLVILFLAVLAAAMFIFPKLHLELVLVPLLKGLLMLVSFLLSFVHFSETSQKVDQTAQNMDMTAVLETLGGNKETGIFWVIIENLLKIAVVIGLAALVIGGTAYLLYRLYKGFYAERKENADEKEFLVGEMKWFSGRGVSGRKAAEEQRGSLNQRIRRIYRQYVKKRLRKKEKVPAALTPEELLAFLEERRREQGLDREAQEGIRAVYERARYGQTECTQAELEEIKELLSGRKRRGYDKTGSQ